MDTAHLIESFSEFKETKNIDRVTLLHILEDVIKNMITKKFGEEANFDIVLNVEKGDLEIYRNREIVDDEWAEDSFDYDPNRHIAFKEAQKIEPDFEIGEEITDQFKLEDFGRRSVQAMRQNLISKINDLEKDNVFRKYQDKVGEVLTGEVYQVWRKEVLVLDDDGNELVLPKHEMIATDFYKKGDTIKAVVLSVEKKNSSLIITLSRTSPVFLEKMFEQEVPEIFDGIITIKKIVRQPGERAKVAVESFDERIDPVGACVGMKGSRIHGIVRELRNENIDVINYTANTSLFIQRALNPAKISDIKIDENKKTASVYLKPDQVSLAIGKGGVNIKLASKLCGYEIEVYREDEQNNEDVALDEFRDEIDGWVIDELKAIGCDTAKSVLDMTAEDLVKRTDLEEETVAHVLEVLRSEFED